VRSERLVVWSDWVVACSWWCSPSLLPSNPASEERMVERRMHASAADARRERAPKRIVRAKTLRIQVVVADTERVPATEPGRAPWRSVDLILVFETWWREVACWIRTAWGGG